MRPDSGGEPAAGINLTDDRSCHHLGQGAVGDIEGLFDCCYGRSAGGRLGLLFKQPLAALICLVVGFACLTLGLVVLLKRRDFRNDRNPLDRDIDY